VRYFDIPVIVSASFNDHQSYISHHSSAVESSVELPTVGNEVGYVGVDVGYDVGLDLF
jgi:hypothetical protein